MNTKKLLVSFIAVFAVLFLVTTVVSAVTFDGDMVNGAVTVKVDDAAVNGNTLSLTAGDTIPVKVWFTAKHYDTDVTVKVFLEGDKIDAEARSASFDVEPGMDYRKSVTLQVPYELKDQLSDNVTLTVTIDGRDYKSESEDIVLRVQRPSYNADIMSIGVAQAVSAGDNVPVDVVLKNRGYDNLDDLYVTASIPALNVQRSGYFGDIVAIECDENADYSDSTSSDYNDLPYGDNTLNRRCNTDDQDTVSGRLFIDVPYGVPAGVYTVEVSVKNADTTSTSTTQLVIENDFESTVFKSGNSIWVVNPTDKVAGYRIVPESPASVDEAIVFVPAGASKSVAVSPNADGDYDFGVKVFTLNGELVDTVQFSGSSTMNGSDTNQTNPIVILTVILAIIFIVLLIVLIVLIGKKPEKSGEFGESYY